MKEAAETLTSHARACCHATSLGSGSAKISESSLHLPGQFRVSGGPDSLHNLQSSVTIYGSLSKPNSKSSHSPISNRNTSQNKLCCQVLATRYGIGSAGDDCWRQGLEGRQGAISLVFKHGQIGGSRRKWSMMEVSVGPF